MPWLWKVSRNSHQPRSSSGGPIVVISQSSTAAHSLRSSKIMLPARESPQTSPSAVAFGRLARIHSRVCSAIGTLRPACAQSKYSS